MGVFSGMNLLDLVIVVAAVAYAVSGYRRGLVASCILLAGFIGGAVIGVWILPFALRPFTAGTLSAYTVAILVVLAPAGLGHALAGRLAWQVRRHLEWGPVRWLDGVGGAATGALSLLAVAWLMASVLVTSPLPGLSREISGSAVLGSVDRALPEQTPTWFSRATGALSGAGFPQVFNPFETEPTTGVPAPTGDEVTTAATRAARQSVVKIEGVAHVGGGVRGQEGSGFVYAPDHVLTNAHVVAGVSDPSVQIDGAGLPYQARVVLFDPETDLAVLDVPGLPAPALHFAGDAHRADPAVVAGYPQDGGLDLRAATVANRITATGQDIYGDNSTTRDIYQLRADVRPGNSGGPLLTPTGQVYGIVFARSSAEADTGYALTDAQITRDAQHGATATHAVSTGHRAALELAPASTVRPRGPVSIRGPVAGWARSSPAPWARAVRPRGFAGQGRAGTAPGRRRPGLAVAVRGPVVGDGRVGLRRVARRQARLVPRAPWGGRGGGLRTWEEIERVDARVGGVVRGEFAVAEVVEAGFFEGAAGGAVGGEGDGDDAGGVGVEAEDEGAEGVDRGAAEALAAAFGGADEVVDAGHAGDADDAVPVGLVGVQVALDEPDRFAVDLDDERLERVRAVHHRPVVRLDGGHRGVRLQPPGADVRPGQPVGDHREVGPGQRGERDPHRPAASSAAGGSPVLGACSDSHASSSARTRRSMAIDNSASTTFLASGRSRSSASAIRVASPGPSTSQAGSMTWARVSTVNRSASASTCRRTSRPVASTADSGTPSRTSAADASSRRRLRWTTSSPSTVM